MFGLFAAIYHLPNYSDKQLGKSGTLILSIFGFTNIVGRLGVGLLSYAPKVNSILINSIAIMVGGVVTFCVPHFPLDDLILVYAGVYGLTVAVSISLRSIIMVELLGIEKLTKSFGLVCLFAGIAALAGPPVAGALLDSTGSYTAIFYMSGISFFLASVVCLTLMRVGSKPG